jgi:transaldolase
MREDGMGQTQRLARGGDGPGRAKESAMNATQQLHDSGQSLWLDNITRALMRSGTLQRYIDEMAVTGLTSNPTIFDQAIGASTDYDDTIRRLAEQGRSGDELFFDLALEDLTAAADLFKSVHNRTDGVDGWVSLEVSPLLAYDPTSTGEQARSLYARAGRPNLYVKIPGTPEGLSAIEESIFSGVPINVTLLFSPEQYVAAAEAYMRGLERRVEAGLPPNVSSVASVFISRWDRAVADNVPAELRNTLGIAVGKLAYRAYRELLDSSRWLRLANFGARPQRLLFASTGTKDPSASDVLYVEAFAAPCTINTMPEATLQAFADHGRVGALLSPDGGDAQQTIDAFAAAGIDVDALALQLQREGAEAFVKSWNGLLARIVEKSAALGAAV